MNYLVDKGYDSVLLVFNTVFNIVIDTGAVFRDADSWLGLTSS